MPHTKKQMLALCMNLIMAQPVAALGLTDCANAATI